MKQVLIMVENVTKVCNGYACGASVLQTGEIAEAGKCMRDGGRICEL